MRGFFIVLSLIAGVFLMFCANSKVVEDNVTEGFNEERLKAYIEFEKTINFWGFILVIIGISLWFGNFL